MSSRFLVVSSLWLVFFVNGAVLSSWAPRIPEVKDRLALSDSEFGLALLGIALGSVPAMLLITRLLRRASDIAVCSGAVLLFPAALPLIDLTTNLAGLTAVLMLLGAVSGALDVAMNALAVRLQEKWGARILGRLHGAFSLGVLAGTAGAAVAIRLGASVGTHFAAVSVALLAASTVASVILHTRAPRQERVSTPPSASTRESHQKSALGLHFYSKLLLAGGIIAIGAFLLEGMLTDWSALLLRRDFHADPALAASVLSMFSIAMFISRSISDTIMHRVRERTFLLFTAIIIALTIPATCATGSVPLVMAGIVVTGFFVGPLFPLALARGGRTAPQHLAEVAAALSIIGYAAHLGGPPLIGFAAEHTSLTFTVAAAVIIVAVVLVSFRKAPETETA